MNARCGCLTHSVHVHLSLKFIHILYKQWQTQETSRLTLYIYKHTLSKISLCFSTFEHSTFSTSQYFSTLQIDESRLDAGGIDEKGRSPRSLKNTQRQLLSSQHIKNHFVGQPKRKGFTLWWDKFRTHNLRWIRRRSSRRSLRRLKRRSFSSFSVTSLHRGQTRRRFTSRSLRRQEGRELQRPPDNRPPLPRGATTGGTAGVHLLSAKWSSARPQQDAVTDRNRLSTFPNKKCYFLSSNYSYSYSLSFNSISI